MGASARKPRPLRASAASRENDANQMLKYPASSGATRSQKGKLTALNRDASRILKGLHSLSSGKGAHSEGIKQIAVYAGAGLL